MEIDDISMTAAQKVCLSATYGNSQVNELKEAAARLITMYEELQAQYPAAAREAALAITHVQTASMFAVFAATS